MMTRVSCEHFTLTPSISEYVERSLSALDHVPRLPSVEVHLVRERAHDFRVVMRTRNRGKDLIGHAEGSDLYAAVHECALILEQRLIERSKKLGHSRRRHRQEMPLEETA